MPLPNWGQLEKSQVDPEKINEAIDAGITDHNNDPDSHVEAGQSLQSHKAAEIIDHRAQSIVTDKLRDKNVTAEKITYTNKNILVCGFESLDCWYQIKQGIGAQILNHLGAVRLDTGSAVNNVTALSGEFDFFIFRGTTDKNPFFKITAVIPQKDLGDFFVGMFDINPWAATSLVGFMWSKADQKLYAYTKAPGFPEQKDEITDVDVESENDYAFESLELGAKIIFYVNGEIKKIVERPGFSVDSDFGPVIGIRNQNADENVEFDAGSLYLYQDK